jgi:hypothetical protein
MIYAKNVPGWERAVRIILGFAAVVLSVFVFKGVVGIVVALAAAGIAISGLVGFCPACALVGRRLAKQQKQ